MGDYHAMITEFVFIADKNFQVINRLLVADGQFYYLLK